jgi:8-oxo-dGTP pyrophosphatase MutT (NUDIX family)
MAVKATFTVGVFGLAAKIVDGVIRIKVNVRTDQERQKELAKLPADSPLKIVDMPGGGVEFEDFSLLKNEGLLSVLEREIKEETGGCIIIPTSAFFCGPYLVAVNGEDPTKPVGDIAFWMPIKLIGEPKPTDEASDHPWISRAQFNAEAPYRCVSGLGKLGRTGRMIYAAFEYYELHFKKPDCLSIFS